MFKNRGTPPAAPETKGKENRSTKGKENRGGAGLSRDGRPLGHQRREEGALAAEGLGVLHVRPTLAFVTVLTPQAPTRPLPPPPRG